MIQTTEISSVVRTQLIPITDMQLLLPNTCIAEVISLHDINPVKNVPEWFLGMMDWRGIRIPVISFEAANKLAVPEISKETRVAVLNGISGDDDLPFYGVISQGIPKLIALERTDIHAVKKPELKLAFAQEQATLADSAAVIPDLKKIETALAKECKKIK